MNLFTLFKRWRAWRAYLKTVPEVGTMWTERDSELPRHVYKVVWSSRSWVTNSLITYHLNREHPSPGVLVSRDYFLRNYQPLK